jgi:ABC-type transporter Mla subunit MlaD
MCAQKAPRRRRKLPTPRQASGQAKQAASSLASDATKQAKGFLNMQVGAGADLVGHVVASARAAAESLDQNAPQLAGLVRNAADRAEAFSQDLRQQTVEDLIRMASDFTRKQPALVFGLASLAGGPGPPYGIGYPMASHKFEVAHR